MKITPIVGGSAVYHSVLQHGNWYISPRISNVHNFIIIIRVACIIAVIYALAT